MTSDDEHAGRAQGEDERSESALSAELPAESPWLLRHKVGLPDAIEGYVERPELEGRCALLEHRLTVLHAPRAPPRRPVEGTRRVARGARALLQDRRFCFERLCARR